MSPEHNKTEVKVRLVITDFSQDPAAISDILGIIPHSVWRVGEPFTPQQRQTHKENGWVFLAPGAPHVPMEQQLEALLQIIEPKLAAFEKLPQQSEVELSCVVYEYGEDNRPCIEFSTKAVKLLARINALINIDYNA